MINNTPQLEAIIAKLLLKTESQAVAWSQSLTGGSYQTRFGDFIVQLSRSGGAITGSNIHLKVSRLNGDAVAQAADGSSASIAALAAASGGAALSPNAAAQLRRLYSLVGDRSKDLEELLNLI